jgi:hypothetical protein
MARTIDEIYGEMIAEKEASANLTGLTSNSRVAVWRLIFYICAVGIKVVEDLFDYHVGIVEQAGLEAIAGTVQWYAAQTLLYQFGDELVYDQDTGNFGYQIIDEDKRVVELAASQDDSTGRVFVKAAKINVGTGIAEPLSVNELAGLTGYWGQKKFAGTTMVVTSELPDLTHVNWRIDYDANVLNGDGELLLDTSVKPVEDAINKFFVDFGVRNFAGIFQIVDLIIAIQAVDGVVNNAPVIVDVTKNDGSGFTDVLATDDNRYISVAGYIIVDPAHPLASNIVYNPQQ